jgi:DNA-binding NarL/FixJ family response regulator
MKMNEVSTESPNQAIAARAPFCIWLVDDQDSVLKLAAELVGRDPRFDCGRQFHSAEAVLAALARESPPDIILTDVNMRGMSGIDSIAPINRLAASTRVFIMTSFYDSNYVARARAEGASGFFLKSGDWEEAIERLADPSADWKAQSPAPVPVDWEAEAADFTLTVREGKPESEANRESAVAAREDRAPLLARAVAVFRALIGRHSCQQRSAQQ